MKKTKIYIGLILLVLCVGFLSIGVFALNKGNNVISGKIRVNATPNEVEITGYVNNQEVAYFNSVRGGITWEEGLKDLTFKLENINNIFQAEDIVVTVKIKNKSTKQLGAYFYNKNDNKDGFATGADIKTEDTTNSKITTVLSSYSFISANDDNGVNTTNDEVYMDIIFRANQFIDEEETLAFNYVLNIEEYVPNTEFLNNDGVTYVSVLPAGTSPTSKGINSFSDTLIKVPYGIASVPAYAFASNVTHVVLPHSVQTISRDAFRGTMASPSSVVAISAPKVTSVQAYAFYNCTSLAFINMPEVTEIGFSGFYNNSATKVIVAPKLITVNQNAFYNNVAIQKVILPKLQTIFSSGFSGCSNLEYIKAQELENVYSHAFYNNLRLQIVDAPMNVIKESAFEGCEVLSNISLSDVTQIGSYSFSGCVSLASMSMPNVLTVGDYAFDGCTLLAEVVLPSVTEVGAGAFEYCTNLKVLSAPNVQTIFERAFAGCSKLTTATILGATKICTKAFDKCSSLKEVEVGSSLQQVGENVFLSCHDDLVVYCNLNYSAFQQVENYQKIINFAKVVLTDQVIEKGAI